MSEIKHAVSYGGQSMNLMEYADKVGVTYATALQRKNEGRIDCPVRKKPIKAQAYEPRKGGYSNGYTREEIKDLYKGFAGQPGELTILMDFTGMTRSECRNLRDQFKKELERRVAV